MAKSIIPGRARSPLGLFVQMLKKGGAPRMRVAQLRVSLLERRDLLSGTWTPFTNLALGGIGAMVQLSDGSVLAQQAGTSNTWYKLTPGTSGNYAANGTWSTAAAMNLQRLYFASNVLDDGRLLVVGGEYSGPQGQQNWTNTGEIYDPVSNTWTSIANFPQGHFGDDPSVLLDNGQVLCGYVSGTQTYLYNPSTNTWSQTGSKIHSDRSDEETWLKLPDGSILSYDVWNDLAGQSTAQRYIPSTGQWVDAGKVPVNLTSSGLGDELGGATLLPDGRAWFVGATGHTAFYTPSTNTWTVGPDLPNGQHADDAPLCQLTNGHVLLAADGPGSTFSPPTHIYDYDPVANTFAEFDPPPLQGNNGVSAFTCRMLALPDGTAALEINGSNQLYVYKPSSGPSSAWAPTISSMTWNNGTYRLTGTQLTGISAGASYGDDAEMDSNYPILVFHDATGHFLYGRSFGWSNTGVEQGSTPQSTQYVVPNGVSNGAYEVQVVTNGIASANTLDVIMDANLNNVTLTFDANNNGLYDIYNGSTLLSQWNINGFNQIFVTMTNAGGTINIESTPSSVATKVYGAGATTINIGNSGSVQGVQGSIQLEGVSNTITVDDSADAASVTAVLTTVAGDNSVNDSDSDSAGQLTGLAPAGITFEYTDTSKISVLMGIGANTMNVLATGTVTDIVGATGNSTNDTYVNVGNGSVSGIQGILNLENPASANCITVNDSADPVAQTVMVTTGSNTYDYDSSTDPWGQVDFSGAAAIQFENQDTNTVTLQIGTAAGTVNVQAVYPYLNIVGGAGGVAVDVGGGNGVQNIAEPVSVEDPTGAATLVVDDSADTATRTVSISNMGTNGMDSQGNTDAWGEIQINAPGASSPGVVDFEYGDTSNVTVLGGSGGNTWTIGATDVPTNLYTGTGNDTLTCQGPPMASLLIDGQAGSDTVVLTSSTHSLAGYNGLVSVKNTSGSTSLTLDDTGDTSKRTVTVNGGSITGYGTNTIAFGTGVTTATINGDSHGDTFNVPVASPGVTTAINGGAGNDTINVGANTRLNSISGVLAINGGGGANVVNASDAGQSTTESYTLSGSTTGPSALTGSTFGGRLDVSKAKLALVLDNYNNTVIVAGSAVPASVTVNGGTGNNTLSSPTLTNNSWTISGHNSGNLGGTTKLVFSNFQSLVGGPSSDTFAFSASNSLLDGTIDGAGGGTSNTLSYTSYAAGINVALATMSSGTAPGVSSGFKNIGGVRAATAQAANSTLTSPPGGYSQGFTWSVTSANSGTVIVTGNTALKFAFYNVGNLVGGSASNVFKLTVAGTLYHVDGGSSGANWLDYSAFSSTSSATVNLSGGPVIVNGVTIPAESATNINGGAANGLTNVLNARGGAGNDTLVGGGGNILVGGSGNDTLLDTYSGSSASGGSLFIGDLGNDTLTGGAAGDILIAGTTSYDALYANLQDILAEWDTAGHGVAFSVLQGTGAGSTKSKLIWGKTVFDDGKSYPDVLNGATNPADVDWFFANTAYDTVNGMRSKVDYLDNGLSP